MNKPKKKNAQSRILQSIIAKRLTFHKPNSPKMSKRKKESPRVSGDSITSLNNVQTQPEVIDIISNLISFESQVSCAKRPSIDCIVLYSLSTRNPCLSRHLSSKPTIEKVKKARDFVLQRNVSESSTYRFFEAQSGAFEPVGESPVRKREEVCERGFALFRRRRRFVFGFFWYETWHRVSEESVCHFSCC